ncbi:hypothetical protein BGZ49_001518 [Haplosporangium sp. Z 27]|nr:hypothetical protein BGZ49_001518 [Haplosporangium sp. Z 27]
MRAQHNLFLALLALLTGLSLTIAWENERFKNWGKGQEVNVLGEPIDVNTACNGKPCERRPLMGPHEYKGPKPAYIPEGFIIVDEPFEVLEAEEQDTKVVRGIYEPVLCFEDE